MWPLLHSFFNRRFVEEGALWDGFGWLVGWLAGWLVG